MLGKFHHLTQTQGNEESKSFGARLSLKATSQMPQESPQDAQTANGKDNSITELSAASVETLNNQHQPIQPDRNNPQTSPNLATVVPLQCFIGKKIAECLKSAPIEAETLQTNPIANPPMVMYALDRSGIITQIKGKGQETLGLKAGEVIGRSVFDLWREYPDVLANIRSVLAGNERSWQSNFQQAVWENHAMPIVQNGQITGLTIMAIDITHRHNNEDRLRLLAAAVEFAEDAIVIATTGINLSGPKIVFVNTAFTKMTGYTAEEVLGRNPRFLQGPKTDRSLLKKLRQNLAEGKMFRGQTINYRQDGSEFYNDWQIQPLRNEKGEITHYLGVQRDISQQKEAETQLLHYAFHDSLTGLPNRTLFTYRLEEALARASQCQDYLFAVLFLDLDRFKAINDSLGHLAGDDLLLAIGQRLRSLVRPTDIVARLGGDEFAIVLDDIKDLGNISRLANRIQKQVSKPLEIQGQEVFTTVSIGIALSSTGYDRPEEILRDADLAMYRAKALGKARSCVFNKTMHQQAVARLQIETDLRHAIERQEFCLYYQPIVSLATGQLTGFEALVRWQHPERGLVSPAEFIPVAEETGAIEQIGWWVLREACTQWRIWQTAFEFEQPLTMSVNISGKQFAQPDLIHKVERILQETGCASSSLKLEITESVLMERNKASIAVLEELRNLGIQLSIDDFGTGYSSLSQLYNLPINTLKIDRSFISGMGSRAKNTEIVKAIVTLARNLGMDAIAEGVETSQQLTQLQELNCQFGQGYFFSKPVDSKTAEKLLLEMPECAWKLAG